MGSSTWAGLSGYCLIVIASPVREKLRTAANGRESANVRERPRTAANGRESANVRERPRTAA
eukprot:5742791-Prymnesium_polylepis.1